MKFKELEGFVYDKKNIKQQVDERRTIFFKNLFMQRKKS